MSLFFVLVGPLEPIDVVQLGNDFKRRDTPGTVMRSCCMLSRLEFAW